MTYIEDRWATDQASHLDMSLATIARSAEQAGDKVPVYLVVEKGQNPSVDKAWTFRWAVAWDSAPGCPLLQALELRDDTRLLSTYENAERDTVKIPLGAMTYKDVDRLQDVATTTPIAMPRHAGIHPAPRDFIVRVLRKAAEQRLLDRDDVELAIRTGLRVNLGSSQERNQDLYMDVVSETSKS